MRKSNVTPLRASRPRSPDIELDQPPTMLPIGIACALCVWWGVVGLIVGYNIGGC